jgi:hypothetical protein
LERTKPENSGNALEFVVTIRACALPISITLATSLIPACRAGTPRYWLTRFTLTVEVAFSETVTCC